MTKLQSFATALVIDKNSKAILQYSENVPTLLKTAVSRIKKHPITDFLRSESANGCYKWLITENKRYKRFIWQGDEATFPVWVYIHQQTSLILLEIELVELGVKEEEAFSVIDEIINLNLEAVFKNAEEAANQFCKKLSKITGFDRTIIYRFEGDKSGVIIGESTSPGMESYLGLHFPATDIPETMRRLYLKQPLLYIPDVHYQAVSLVPEGKHLVDLTESLLRAVSPGYLDYLHKMGISSSLSVAIRYKNALWGLITFQHKQAKKLSPPYRLGIVLLAKSLGRALIMIDKTRQIKNLQKNIIQSAKLTTIGQLAAGVAHEINNPLSYVVNNIYLIQSYFGLIKTAFFAYSQVLDDLHKTPGFNKSKQYEDIMIFNQENKLFTKLASLDDILSETIEGSIRLKQIVSNLTVFSGGSHEEPEYVDINALIEAAIKLTWNEVKYKSTLVKNLNEIPKVYVVPEHLELVFVNLLLNAVQAIETKGEIKISSSRLGSNILVTVSDTGCGIPSENIPKLFTPFFTTKALGSSIGLGLANAYGLIDRLGGKMTVTSKVGRGSTFSILVPINKTE